MTLEIITGVEMKPPRLFIYGTPGIGKTTFAAQAPDPIFLQTEEGADLLGVNRFPLARSADDVREYLGQLLHEDHQFSTLVIDSMDELESMLHDEVCRQHNAKSITDEYCKPLTYGKGYTIAARQMDAIRQQVDALREQRHMMIIVIAHSSISRFEDPEHDPYDRYMPKMHKNANAIWQQWADAVLFANWEVFTHSKDVGFNKEHTRAMTSGNRVLHTTERPSAIAKNRYALPEVMPLDWSAVYGAICAAGQAATEQSPT